MPQVQWNQADNVNGWITYSAGIAFGSPPVTDTFLFASIRFRGRAESPPTGAEVRFHSSEPRRTLVTDHEGNEVAATLQSGAIRVSAATLLGTVRLQARGSAPSSRFVVPLTVTLSALGGAGVVSPTFLYTPTTDVTGQFTVTGFAPGTYDLKVKKAHTLTNKKAGVALESGHNTVNLGTLLEGDANDNGAINALDYAPLASAYFKQSGQAGLDARVDFNEDGRINSSDYAPLASNYFKRSDVDVLLSEPRMDAD